MTEYELVRLTDLQVGDNVAGVGVVKNVSKPFRLALNEDLVAVRYEDGTETLYGAYTSLYVNNRRTEIVRLKASREAVSTIRDLEMDIQRYRRGLKGNVSFGISRDNDIKGYITVSEAELVDALKELGIIE